MNTEVDVYLPLRARGDYIDQSDTEPNVRQLSGSADSPGEPDPTRRKAEMA